MEITDEVNAIPKARIEIKPADVKRVKPFPPGSRIVIVLRGTVTEQFLRKLQSEKELSAADITVEVKEFSIRASGDNDIYKLFEDDEL